MTKLPTFITREFIRNHRSSHIFIYGESYLPARDWIDDANQCRGEPNCYGIVTCRCFSLNPGERVFTQKEMEGIRWRILSDIQSIPESLIYIIEGDWEKQRVVAMPLLGRGESLMEAKTPELYLYMIRELKKRFPTIIIL